jgi:DNA-binding transcriptional regulator/RsmH inhibitor MraZ
MIFTGIHLCPVDKLTRIILPKVFRSNGLTRGGTLYTRPKESYIIAAPEAAVLNYLEVIASGDADDDRAREIRRCAMALFRAVHVDPQGRCKLSFDAKVKEGDSMVLVGTGHDFEIWNREEWVNHYPEMEPES